MTIPWQKQPVAIRKPSPLYDRYLDRIYACALRQAGDVFLAGCDPCHVRKALQHLRRQGWRGHSFLAGYTARPE
jgi:hypothetical protein